MQRVADSKLISAALATVLVGLLYGPTISLPYFWDDFPNFNFAINKTYFQLWTDVTGLPYYRPVIFTLYKFLFELLPFGATTLPHGLMLAVHIFNSVAVGRLAGNLVATTAQFRKVAGARGSGVVMLAGSALFAVYPFGAQPVPHFAAATHPLVTGLVLSGALAINRFIQTRRQRWLGLALLCAALAPFTHEAGIMAGLVLVLIWFTREGVQLLLRPYRPMMFLAVNVLYLPVWLTVPKSRAESGLTLLAGRPEDLLASATFFFQALSYPLQPLATVILNDIGGWDLGVVLGVGLAGVIAAAIYLGGRSVYAPTVVAFGWTALTSLPSIAALSFDYIWISPRLLYFPGVGGALLWAVTLGALTAQSFHPLWRAWVRWMLAAALIGGALVAPIGYLQRQSRLYRLALTPLSQINAIVRRWPTERHLIVNTVNWLAYNNRWYPLGNDGVPVLAPYLGLGDLIWINTGIRPRIETATFPDLLPRLSRHYLSTASEGADELWNVSRFTERVPNFDRVWLTTYTDDRIETQYVGYVLPPSQPIATPTRYLARVEDQLYLMDGHIEVDGQNLNVTLDWMLTAPGLQGEAVVFRNVFDCAGNVLGLGSGRPVGRMLALEALPAGTQIHDRRSIPLDRPAGDGCYRVEVGLFLADGSRLPLYAPDGSEYPNRLVLLQNR